jgi:hypothetical protein
MRDKVNKAEMAIFGFCGIKAAPIAAPIAKTRKKWAESGAFRRAIDGWKSIQICRKFYLVAWQC